jgi:hypothetical protein
VSIGDGVRWILRENDDPGGLLVNPGLRRLSHRLRSGDLWLQKDLTDHLIHRRRTRLSFD